MIEIPTVMINFKTYDEASGKDALELASIASEVAKETNTSVICCVQAADVHACAKQKVPIFAQHIDIEPAGGHTGKNSIKSLVENGVTGCLVNHSENRIPFTKIMETIALLSEADIVSVVCVQDAREAKKVAKLTPDMIAIEPPELIGGDVSVTTANPSIVSESVQAVQSVNKGIPVLCGAGVKNGKDVKAAIKLGASGVLVASGITKATDKKKALMNLVKGL